MFTLPCSGGRLDLTNQSSFKLCPVESAETYSRSINVYLCIVVESPLGKKPISVMRKLKNSACSTSPREFLDRQSELYDLFVKSSRRDQDDVETRHYLKTMEKTHIFPEYLHWFRTGDPIFYKYILQVFGSLKKIELSTVQSSADALRAWYETEERICQVRDTLPLDHIKNIICGLLDFKRMSNLPKFGPGKVSDKRISGQASKLDNLVLSAIDNRFFYPGPNFGFGRAGDNQQSMLKGSSHEHNVLARYKEVAKSYKTRRSICIEPLNLTLSQQQLRMELESSIESSLFSRFIKIDDQSYNRDLALAGSVTNLSVTIDLSSASDSVRWDLVKKIFPRSLVIDFFKTRSSFVKTPDGPYEVVKFAPMGSGVCFPVQSILFCAVCIYAGMVISAEQSRASLDALTTIPRWFVKNHFGESNVYGDLGVYGDDIIVSVQLADTVIHLLTALGFLVNESKSFLENDCFRESCGGYYYRGSDVTPKFIRMNQSDKDWEAYASLFGMVNNHSGTVRAYLIHVLKTKKFAGKRRSIIFSSEDSQVSFSIHSKMFCNLQTHSRKNIDLDTWIYLCHNGNGAIHTYIDSISIEYKSTYVKSYSDTYRSSLGNDKEASDFYDAYLYNEWMRSRILNRALSPSETVSVIHGPTLTQLSERWTPQVTL